MNHYQYCNKTQKIQTDLERSFVYDRFYIDPSYFYKQYLVRRDVSFRFKSVEHIFEAPKLMSIIRNYVTTDNLYLIQIYLWCIKIDVWKFIIQITSQFDVLRILWHIISIKIQWHCKRRILICIYWRLDVLKGKHVKRIYVEYQWIYV